MRHDATVVSLSWIPTEAATGLNKVILGSGILHCDVPPPDRVGDLEALREADRFRFANDLSAWVEVEDGRIVDAGYAGGTVAGATTVALGDAQATFAAVPLPVIQKEIERTDTAATFVQTVGGRTALPAPRRVNHAPFVAFEAPTVWTTLSLTIGADGTATFEVVGASTFPRHWVYGPDGELAAKVGLTEFKEWWRNSFGNHTPWGDEESPAFVTEVETSLERELSTQVMRGGPKPKLRKLREGALLTEQGAPGDEVFLLLNGVVAVEVDDERLAEIGPGAILGERSALEGGTRTATLRALTDIKVAVVRPDDLSADARAELVSGHRREDDPDR